MIKLDFEKLKEVLTVPNNQMTRLHLTALEDLIRFIFNKHLFSYSHYYEDLRDSAIAAVIEKRKYYDISKNSFTFLYTIIRNDMTNNIYHWTKFNQVELNEVKEGEISNSYEIRHECPSVNKYASYITGDKKFEYLHLSKDEAFELFIFLNQFKKLKEVPQYIKDIKNSQVLLYTLFTKVWDKF